MSSGGGTINFCQRTLGELFDFRNGLSKGKEFFGKGTPFVRYTDVYNHRTLRKKDITALVECTDDEKERLKVSRGDVLFTRTSETAEDIGWSSVMLDDMDDCVFNGFTIKATPKTKELLPEYCAYCFSTSDFRQYVTKHCAFTTRASLTGNTIAQYRMTIPPLDIQSRIVNVLDNFEKICSDLNIGLPAEIEARQKQYEYYRDKLLTFAETGNTILSRAEQSRAEQSRAEQSRALIKLVQYVYGCVWLELGDVIVSLNTGLNPRKFFKLNTEDATNYYITIREMKDGKIVPSEKTDRMNDEARKLCNNRSNLEVGDVLFSGTGTIGETAVIEKEPSNWNIKEGVYAIKPNQTMIKPMYLRYILMTGFIKKEYMKKAAGGTVQSVPMGELKKIRIPVPSLQEQNRIVGVLKQLDDLCNDLTSGLPAEIEARQKQYEYYRDKLLSFKERL